MSMKIPKSLEEKTNDVLAGSFFFTMKQLICLFVMALYVLCWKSINLGLQQPKKRLKYESLRDNRGRRSSECSVRMTDEIKKVIQEHCSSIPHSESHYKRADSSVTYFDNSDLTLTKLYSLFEEYYTEKTGNLNIRLSELTYSKYFNHNLNFAFSKFCNLFIFLWFLFRT